LTRGFTILDHGTIEGHSFNCSSSTFNPVPLSLGKYNLTTLVLVKTGLAKATTYLTAHIPSLNARDYFL